MGGRSSTYKERIKSIGDLIKELDKKYKSSKESDKILDLGNAEAETKLEGNFKYKDSLNDKNYMICNSLNDIDKKIKESTIDQIAFLSNRYKHLIKNILDDSEVKVRSYAINDIYLKRKQTLPNYSTIACWSKSTKQICINQRVNKSYESVVEKVKYSQSTGHFMQTDNNTQDRYILTHEFGHFLEDCLIKKRLNTDTYTEPQRYREALNITDEICQIAKSKYKATATDIQFISKYGHTNAYEWFAEMFTSSILSSQKSPLNNAMLDYLRKKKENKQ